MTPSEPARIGPEDVRKLADLAKIDLAPEEIAPLCDDLEAVLRYVRQLDEVDTEGVAPLDMLGDGRLREDVPTPTLTPEELELLNGYDPLSSYFPVPAVFGDGGH